MVLAVLAALHLQLSGAVAPEPCVDTCAPAAFPHEGAGPCAPVDSQHVSLAQPLQLAQRARAPLPGLAQPVLAQQRAAGSPAWTLWSSGAACGAASPPAAPQGAGTPCGTCSGAACRQLAAPAHAETCRAYDDLAGQFELPGEAGVESGCGAASDADYGSRPNALEGAAAARVALHGTGLQGDVEADGVQSSASARMHLVDAAGAALQHPRQEAPGEQRGAAERAHAVAVALSWAGQADAHVHVTGTCAVPAKAGPETAGDVLGGCEPAASRLAAESMGATVGAFGASVPLWELLRAEISSGASPELAGQHEHPEPDPARRPMKLERAPEAITRFAAAWQRVVSTHNLAELLAEGRSQGFQHQDLGSDESSAGPGMSLDAGSAATCARAGVGGRGAGSPGCVHGRRLPPRDWRVLAAGLLLMGGSAAACAVMLFWMVGAKLVPPERAAAWLGTSWGTGPAQAWWVAAWAFAAADTHYCLLLPLTLPAALAFVLVNWMSWKLFMLN